MSQRALVTGASGFMARHLIPSLIQAGWEVVGTARRPRPSWLPDQAGYQALDLAGSAHLEPLCQGTDAIFHLAGATSSLSSTEEMHSSNVVATTRLVAAALAAGAGRFVHMGSTSIYGEEVPLPQPLLESVAPHPSRGYGKAKWQAEEAVWAGVAQGLEAVVLRPVSVFGPGAVKLLASAVLDVAIERHAGLARLQVYHQPIELRLVHVADVLAAARHLATAPSSAVAGRAYNLVAAHYPSALELAGLLGELVGMAVEESDDPGCGLDLTGRRGAWEAMLSSGMAGQILFTEERLRFLKKENRNNRLSVDALLGTGFSFAYGDEAGLRRGIQETVEWYRAQHWIA